MSEREADYPAFVQEQIRSITEVLTRVMFGDFTVVARTTRPDEVFGYLCAMINVAINAARNAQNELRVTNRDLESRISELRAREEQIRELNGQLEKLVEVRTQELRASESQFATLAGISPVGIFRMDSEGRTIYLNERGRDILSLGPGEVRGDGWARALHPEDRARVFAEWQNAVQRRTPWLSTHRFCRADGAVTWVLTQAVPEMTALGEMGGFAGTITDITELKAKEQALETSNDHLKEAKEKAELAYKELEAFSYSVSHDLRAPLRAINGYSQIFLEAHAEKLDTEGKRVLGVVKESARRMGELIDDLLEFSRMGRVTMRSSTLDMSGLALSVLNQLLVACQGRKIEASVGPLPAAWGDHALLKQMLVSLLENAIKYTARRDVATIEVGGSSNDRENTYWVKDNGAGFEMAYAHKLFGVFQRLHSSEEFEGTGVGLALVQRIIQRHGGRVWAEGAVNKGATFYFTLPKPGKTDGGA